MDALMVARDVSGAHILESELRTIAKRLLPYWGKDLWPVIQVIPAEAYYPSGIDLENRMRKLRGLPVAKGLDEERIAENERLNVLAGQDPKKARIGAEVARNTLRKAPIPAKKPEPSPLAELDDFGEDPLSALEDF